MLVRVEIRLKWTSFYCNLVINFSPRQYAHHILLHFTLLFLFQPQIQQLGSFYFLHPFLVLLPTAILLLIIFT